MKERQEDAIQRHIEIPVHEESLQGTLNLPADCTGLVAFVHGSGSSRLSPRNRYVSDRFNTAGMGTLLFGLLTDREESIDRRNASLRFDIPFLTERLSLVLDWIGRELPRTLKVGLFGASTGAAAALVSAAQRPEAVDAVVSRGGRPDLAEGWLESVVTPTLLIVGERDETVLALNREALDRVAGEKKLVVIPGATHLFEERGTLEKAAREAQRWFEFFLAPGEPLLLDGLQTAEG